MVTRDMMDEGSLDRVIRADLMRMGVQGVENMTIWEIAATYPTSYEQSRKFYEGHYTNDDRTDFEEFGEC